MFYVGALCVMLFCGQVAPVPSHGELARAVIANREKVRSLHVRARSHRTVQQREVRKELYLDADARRWRIDTTGLTVLGESSRRDEPVIYSSSTGVDGAIAYLYDPTTPRLVARKLWLDRGIEDLHVHRFPDPRNAGLVPASQGNTGTPFEISGGTRICLHTFYVNRCLDASEVAVEPVSWNGKGCWNVQSKWAVSSTQDDVCSYVVAPGMDHSVVYLEIKGYFDKEATPRYVSSVESQCSLHEESGIWFPARLTYRLLADGKRTDEEITDIEVVSLNKPIPEKTFSFGGMGVPPGHFVFDETDGQSTTKVWDGEKLVRMHGLPPLRDAESAAVLTGVGRRWLLIGLASVCLCLAGGLLWRTARQGRRSRKPS